MSGIFWPPRPQHVVRTVELPLPMLSPELIEPIRNILLRIDALRSVQACSDPDSHVVNELKKSVASHLTEISSHLQDADSLTAIGYIAEGLMGSAQFASMSQAVAALDERELVAHVGDLSTWLGKSRKTFSSAFFGAPNPRLQRVSDCVDEHFPDAGSAYIQLRLLHDSGVVDCTNSLAWSVDTELFVGAMRAIAHALIDAALAGDLFRFEAFISKYCPHRLEGEEGEFMFDLAGCDITLGYAQEIFEGSVNAIQ